MHHGRVLLLVTLFAASGAMAQCATAWSPGTGVAGCNDEVLALANWDPDGSGPLPPVVVVGGMFTLAGTVATRGVATYEPVSGSWGSIGGGVSGTGSYVGVLALAVMPNGDLVAGGRFSQAGGTPTTNLARWDGSTWHAVGGGVGGAVSAIAAMPNGDLAVASDQVPGRILLWNGTTWSLPGTGVDNRVFALAAMPNGDLVAGGWFGQAGGVSVNQIARWDGANWSALGTGTGGVQSLLVLQNGDLLVGGGFSGGALNANGIALWNGATWSALGSGMPNPVQALARLPNGDLLAGGQFLVAGGVAANFVARWDGSAWSPLASGTNGSVAALAVTPGGDVIAGGTFGTAGNVGASHVARWNGTAWSATDPGTNGAVQTLRTMRNGDVVAGGDFSVIGGVSAQRLARWNGTAWSAMGTGCNDSVRAVHELPNGDLAVGGLFTQAGGVQVANVARWDGASWSALGAGLPGPVHALGTLANGDLVAGGAFLERVMRWDGASWQGMGIACPLGAGVAAGLPLRAMTFLPNGDLVVSAGLLLVSGGQYQNVARWNGLAWSVLPGLPAAETLVSTPAGELLAGGAFLGGGVAVWNGVAWATAGPLGPGSVRVHALQVLPDGDVLVGGNFTTIGGVAGNSLARWDRVNWSPVGAGADAPVVTLALQPQGELFAGGYFNRVDGRVAAHLARLATNCPAIVATSGAGCSGAGGLDVLTGISRPWLGSTYRSLATGLPTNALAVRVLGLGAAATPLNSLLPQGLPGCTLWVTPDLLEAAVPVGGVVALALSLPGVAALAGVVVHEQVATLELDALGGLTAVTSTNGLTLTIGVF